MIPAMAGAETDVPPTTEALVNTFWPFTEAVAQPPKKQKRYPSSSGDAFKETSGMSRTASAGTPVPACQEGLGYPAMQVTLPWLSTVDWLQLLGPPPPPSRL